MRACVCVWGGGCVTERVTKYSCLMGVGLGVKRWGRPFTQCSSFSVVWDGRPSINSANVNKITQEGNAARSAGWIAWLQKHAIQSMQRLARGRCSCMSFSAHQDELLSHFAIVTSGWKIFHQQYMVNTCCAHTHWVIVFWGLHRSAWVTCLDRITNDADWLERIKVGTKISTKPTVWDTSEFIFLGSDYVKSPHPQLTLQKLLYICGFVILLWTNVTHASGKGPLG